MRGRVTPGGLAHVPVLPGPCGSSGDHDSIQTMGGRDSYRRRCLPSAAWLKAKAQSNCFRVDFRLKARKPLQLRFAQQVQILKVVQGFGSPSQERPRAV